MNRDCFIEVDSHQARKHGQPVSGDAFLSRKIKEEKRAVAVLADGLGSGVKASVLATLTSTMALRFVSSDTDVQEAAGIILDILPVCSQRRIGYSTFTIVDASASGAMHVIEHDNPPFIFINGKGEPVTVEKTTLTLPTTTEADMERHLLVSRFHANIGDRLVFFSDGVNQSGMGRPALPLGWGMDSVLRHVTALIAAEPRISARELARRLVEKAVENDEGRPKDDVTCAVLYFRRPRQLLMVTGPPFSKGNDALMAAAVEGFSGKRVICGGTTATIIARELKRQVTVHLDDLDVGLPPTSEMAGVDLVTEGTITLAKAAEMLEQNIPPEALPTNAACRLVQLLIDSDIVHFLVGTKINEAHQDPNVPVELDIRRNIVKRIRALLEERHLKETRQQFL